MNKFKFSVLTQSGTGFEGQVEKVIVSASDGEITVLKNHIPLIAMTNTGRLIVFVDNDKFEFIANAGVLKIDREEVVLMSDKIQKLK
jgi:F-type H+-transporting ATPase subunit epsilon